MAHPWKLALPKLITVFLIPIKSRDEALQEVEEIEKDPTNLFPFDDHIKILVAGLRRFGILTEGSCDGHITEDKHNHPWISLPNKNDIWHLMWLSWVWQQQKGLLWVIDRSFNALGFQPAPDATLTLARQQQDALNFGEFLLSDNFKSVIKRLSSTPGRLTLAKITLEISCAICKRLGHEFKIPVLLKTESS